MRFRVIEADTPIYRRIASRLESEIVEGKLKVGDKLPSERAMAEQLGISRMTARQALRHLTAKGMLETRTGQGTYVGQPVIEQKLSTLTGFTEEMDKQGRQSSSIVVQSESRIADKVCVAALKLPANGKIYRLVRIRLVDGIPVAIETTDIRADRAPGLLNMADFAQESLYGILTENYNVLPAMAEQSLAASTADASTARSLNLDENAPVLKLTRLTFDSDGNPFEFVRSVYRGDSFIMKVDLTIGMTAIQ
jgi:DNA-binding GntR family transcriptional regulator